MKSGFGAPAAGKLRFRVTCGEPSADAVLTVIVVHNVCCNKLPSVHRRNILPVRHHGEDGQQKWTGRKIPRLWPR